MKISRGFFVLQYAVAYAYLDHSRKTPKLVVNRERPPACHMALPETPASLSLEMKLHQARTHVALARMRSGWQR